MFILFLIPSAIASPVQAGQDEDFDCAIAMYQKARKSIENIAHLCDTPPGKIRLH